ncbi:MAG: prepilin-type N-terminal cleavage/methylation domain-containing protein [Rhodoferax sp.]|nr:prepilin-type N-terminal cleavage/methylation domain-containing protein [Rhodoferax sp.]
MPRTAAFRPTKQDAQRGFSLLEAVVAMVILASTGWALLAWINSSIASLGRIEESNARSLTTANVLEYMQTVNPMLRPDGRVRLGLHTIAWTARPLTPVIDGSGFPRGPSFYQLAMYEIAVRAFRGDELDPSVEFRMKQVGYRQVRESFNVLRP